MTLPQISIARYIALLAGLWRLANVARKLWQRSVQVARQRHSERLTLSHAFDGGYAAYGAFHPRWCNPYRWQWRLRRAWHAGYNDARRSYLAAGRYQGRQARRAGLGLRANPYRTTHGEIAQAWVCGWLNMDMHLALHSSQ